MASKSAKSLGGGIRKLEDAGKRAIATMVKQAVEVGDLSELARLSEAADAYKDELGPKGLPVARRRDGWSFLVADADDLQRLDRVTVDGEMIISQIAGELADVSTPSWACYADDVPIPQIEQSCRAVDVLREIGRRSWSLNESYLQAR